jgi:hypothetical protein
MTATATSKWDYRTAPVDRRASQRYPIQIAVTFKIRHNSRTMRTGSGRTIDLSSRGVRILTDNALPAGGRVELCIAWPAVLQDGVALNLFVSGQVVRSGEIGSGHYAAIAFQRYLFRIRAVRKKTGSETLTHTFQA